MQNLHTNTHAQFKRKFQTGELGIGWRITLRSFVERGCDSIQGLNWL